MHMCRALRPPEPVSAPDEYLQVGDEIQLCHGVLDVRSVETRVLESRFHIPTHTRTPLSLLLPSAYQILFVCVCIYIYT